MLNLSTQKQSIIWWPVCPVYGRVVTIVERNGKWPDAMQQLSEWPQLSWNGTTQPISSQCLENGGFPLVGNGVFHGARTVSVMSCGNSLIEPKLNCLHSQTYSAEKEGKGCCECSDFHSRILLSVCLVRVLLYILLCVSVGFTTVFQHVFALVFQGVFTLIFQCVFTRVFDVCVLSLCFSVLPMCFTLVWVMEK